MTRNSLQIVCFVLLCLFLSIPLVSADSQIKLNPNKIQRWTPSPDSSVLSVSLAGMKSISIIDSRKIIVNFTQHLDYLNTEMGWNLSPKQINGYSVSMRSGSLKKYVYNQTYPEALDIPNQQLFYSEISDAMSLNEGESEKIVQKVKEKYRQDFVNNDRPDQESIRARNLKTMENISFGVTMYPYDSESAPYAHGKVAYFCIFTDFQYPMDIPPGFTYAWTDDAISAVMTMVSWAADDIYDAAPAGAGISSEYGYTGPDTGIYVEGSNTGNNQDSYGQNGWMERALKSIELTGGGYITDADNDGWVSDDFVQELKDYTFTDADYIVLIFLSHDNKGGYSMDPDYNDGYTDRAQVPFWAPGPTNPNEFIISQYGVYQHEILHTVGAADEYEDDPQVYSCNARSYNAVSPMFELYGNTNHEDCPSHNDNTIMNNPYDYTVISGSSRNFIGWGDYDGDGTLDPLDSSPYGNAGTKIGIFRPSTHLFYQDYNGNGKWDGAIIDRSYNFGITGDLAITGDWNGDDRTEIGVFRPSTHLYYQDYNRNGIWDGAITDRSYNFGITGDTPVSGDWNDDGITEIGIYRPSTYEFYLDYNGNEAWDGALTDRRYVFGMIGDKPITGDWNDDGITEIGIFRPSTHLFYLDYNGNGAWDGAVTDRQYNFGITDDIPVTGDWNNNGITEIGVYRPSTHLYYQDYNGNGVWDGAMTDRSYNFGISGDIPVSGKWI